MDGRKNPDKPQSEVISDAQAIAQIPQLIEQVGNYGEPLRKKMENVFGENLYSILLHGIDSMSEVGDKTHRLAFIRYIHQNLNNIKRYSGRVDPDKADKATISMNDLLRDEGVKLYQKAIEEEVRSPAFLYAVANKATVYFEGARLLNRVWAWEGGGSGSGKTYSAMGVIKELLTYLPKVDENDKQGNYFVFVDGGIARELSQMRQLALLTALRCGYSGISDLHKLSDALDIKHTIKNMAIESERVNGLMVLDTFSKCFFDCQQMKDAIDIIEKKRMIHVFSEVVPPEGKAEQFSKELVPRMASERSWSRKYGPENAKLIGFRFNTKLDCESKKPPLELSIKRGLEGTAVARNTYTVMNPHPIHIIVVNDLMYEGSVRLSARDYAKYLDSLTDKPTNLQAWLDEMKQKNLLAPPLVKVKKFDIDPLHAEYFGLLDTASRMLSPPSADRSLRGSKSSESSRESSSSSPSPLSRAGSLSISSSRSSKKSSPGRANMLHMTDDQIRNQIINRLVAFTVNLTAGEINNTERNIMLATIGEKIALLINAEFKHIGPDIKKMNHWLEKMLNVLDNDEQKFIACHLLIQNWKTQIDNMNISNTDKIAALKELHLIANAYLVSPSQQPTETVANLLANIAQEYKQLEAAESRPLPPPRKTATSAPVPPPRDNAAFAPIPPPRDTATTAPIPAPRQLPASTSPPTAPPRKSQPETNSQADKKSSTQPGYGVSSNPSSMYSQSKPSSARPAPSTDSNKPPPRPPSTPKK